MKHPYINTQNVKQLALDMAKNSGRVRFTRVGESFLDRVEARLRNIIEDEIKRHPSVGVTLK
jgi:hypothetical protein